MLDAEMLKAPETRKLSGSAWLVLDRIILGSDDEGRLEADEEALRATLFPRGYPSGWNVGIAWAAVVELLDARVVAYYERDGRKVLCLPGFKLATHWQYQAIRNPLPSLLPAPPVRFPEAKRTRGNAPKGAAPDDAAHTKFRNCLERLAEQYPQTKEGPKEPPSLPFGPGTEPPRAAGVARGAAPAARTPHRGGAPLATEKRTARAILNALKPSDPPGKIRD